MKCFSFSLYLALPNLTSAGSPLGLLVYCNWITTCYTNHCFNLFFVSKLFMLLSLCYTMTLSMLLVTLLISVYFIRVLSLTVCNQASNKCRWLGNLKQLIRHIVLYAINNCNSVILGMEKAKREISPES